MSIDPVADLQAELTDQQTGAQYYQNMGDAPSTSDTDAVGYYKQAAGLASDAAAKASARAPSDVDAASYAQVASTSYMILLGIHNSTNPRLTAETAASQGIVAAQRAIDLVRKDLTATPVNPTPGPPIVPPAPTDYTTLWLLGGVVAAAGAAIAASYYFDGKRGRKR